MTNFKISLVYILTGNLKNFQLRGIMCVEFKIFEYTIKNNFYVLLLFFRCVKIHYLPVHLNFDVFFLITILKHMC